MDQKFSDGSATGFEELPVEVAWLTWTRGDAKLSAAKDTDPGSYFGGWRAFAKGKDRTSGEERENPKLPIPLVTRVSEDGSAQYQVYATNDLRFLPINHRTRFEMREETTDPNTGREYQKLLATSSEKPDIKGYSPVRQIFGLVFSADLKKYAPAVIHIKNWSSFISFEKAGQKFNKLGVPDNKALIRRYGSIGNEKGQPNFEIFGQSRSTPIEAIGVDKPILVDITDEMINLLEGSMDWKTCPKWNATGGADDQEPTIVQQFNAACDAIGMTNVDIEQLLADNGNNYYKALAALQPPSEDDVNAYLASAEAEDQA